MLLKEKTGRKTGYILWVLCCITLFTGCSAKRNTGGTRAYHELTTRYNIYFNAEEAYNEILKDRSNDMHTDYAELLPFYPALSETEKLTPGGPFDPVIEKTEKAIREHSITAKPRRDPSKAQSQEYRQWLRQEEFNPFLKNVWLLRGKAFLQNGDYNEALSVFSGMLRLFSHDDYLVDETEIWMLRTYTEMGRMFETEKTIYALKNKNLSPDLQKLYADHYTYYLIRKRDYREAIPHLRKTITTETDHPRKQKLQFLLGQLYATTGEKQMAYRAFEEVKGLRTPFQLTLNATLWQSALTSGEQQRKIMQRLHKMEQKVNDADSTTLLNRRYQTYLKAGNDSLALAFKPSMPSMPPMPSPDTGRQAGSAVMTAATDSADSLSTIPQGTPQRLSEGRTLAENAAIHRQWRTRNGLWQPQSASTVIPFSIDKNGPHSLLLTFHAGSAGKNQLIFTTADFNFSHFKLRRFNVSPISLPGSEAIQIEPFHSFEEAGRYTEIMYADSLFFATVPEGITPVIISEENLQLIRTGRGLDEYNIFYAENIGSTQIAVQTAKKDRLMVEFEEKNKQEQEKIVSLETPSVIILEPVQQTEKEILTIPEPVLQTESTTPAAPGQFQKPGRETPETVKRRLEENAAKALQQQPETASPKERKQLVKERERERKERIRQREKEIKERQRQRERELKQREKERAHTIKGKK